MPSFSRRSESILETCHDDLQRICRSVIKTYDFTVLEGHRSNQRQNELYRQGKSKLQGGQSKHNRTPSLAVDIAPYPIDWSDLRRFYLLAGFMFQSASDLGIKIRFGGDWNMNWDLDDQTFFDLPHYELVGE